MFTKIFTMAAAAAVATSPAWPTPCPEFVYEGGWSVNTSAETQWDGVFHESVGFYKAGAQNGDVITVHVADGDPLPPAGGPFSGTDSFAESVGTDITVSLDSLPADMTCDVTGNMNFWWGAENAAPDAAEDYYDVFNCRPLQVTPEPSDEPTEEPTDEPSEVPSDEPSEVPTDEPTDEPSEIPSDVTSDEPSETADETETPAEEASEPSEEVPEPSAESPETTTPSTTDSEAQNDTSPAPQGRPSAPAHSVSSSQSAHAKVESSSTSSSAPAARRSLAHTGIDVEAVMGAVCFITITGLAILTYAIDRKER